MATWSTITTVAIPIAPFLFAIPVVVFVFVALFFLQRYKRCPPNRALIVYGRVGGSTARCITGGGMMVWPVIQDFAYLSLEPMRIEMTVLEAIGRDDVPVDLDIIASVAISREPGIMQNAAERLLGLDEGSIARQACDILIGQCRRAAEDIPSDQLRQVRSQIIDATRRLAAPELAKIGLEIIDLHVRPAAPPSREPAIATATSTRLGA